MMTFEDYPLHDSIRGWFGRALYFEMQKNPNLICLTADLGYGLFCEHKKDFPNQFYNVGAAEQCMLGTAIGLTLSGQTVFCYSITSFLLYRGYEWIRNFLQHENIPVRLIGSGLEDDYKNQGITHHTFDAREVLKQWWRIDTYFPETKEQVPDFLKRMIETDKPSFICLRR